MSDKKNVLLCGAGKDQLPGIKYCLELGLGVYALDGRENAEGFSFCDGYEVCDIKAPDEVEKAALKWNKKVGIDGVIAFGVEVGPSVGRVVDRLGLIGINETTALKLTDKILRRIEFDQAGIRQPRWAYREEKKEKLWDIFPAVVKPRDQAGARGVRLARSYDEFGLNWDYVEEYLEGWEISTECLVLPDGNFILVNADRHYDKKLKWAPYLLEDGCTVPSKLPLKMQRKIIKTVKRIVDYFQLRSCAIKLDLLIKDNLVYALECAARLGGGKLSSIMIPQALGIDWWKLAVKLAMGMSFQKEDFVQKSGFCSQRYSFPENPCSHYDRTGSLEVSGTTYQQAFEGALRKQNGRQ